MSKFQQVEAWRCLRLMVHSTVLSLNKWFRMLHSYIQTIISQGWENKLGSNNKSRASFNHRSSSVPRNGSMGQNNCCNPNEVDNTAPIDFARDRPMPSKGLLADKVRETSASLSVNCAL